MLVTNAVDASPRKLESIPEWDGFIERLILSKDQGLCWEVAKDHSNGSRLPGKGSKELATCNGTIANALLVFDVSERNRTEVHSPWSPPPPWTRIPRVVCSSMRQRGAGGASFRILGWFWSSDDSGWNVPGGGRTRWLGGLFCFGCLLHTHMAVTSCAVSAPPWRPRLAYQSHCGLNPFASSIKQEPLGNAAQETQSDCA